MRMKCGRYRQNRYGALRSGAGARASLESIVRLSTKFLEDFVGYDAHAHLTQRSVWVASPQYWVQFLAHDRCNLRPWKAWQATCLIEVLAILNRNCLKHVQSNSMPSQLLPTSCLPNPGRGPKSNRTSRLFPVVLMTVITQETRILHS